MKRIMTVVILVFAVLMFSSSGVLADGHEKGKMKMEPLVSKVTVEMINADGTPLKPDVYEFIYEDKLTITKNGEPMNMDWDAAVSSPPWGGNPPHNSEILSIHSRNPTWVCNRWGCGWK